MEIKDNQTIRVVVGKTVKRISLQRFIITKIVLEPDKISSRDIFTLFYNQIWLQDKCYREKEFQIKFSKSLEVLAIILRNLNLSTEITEDRIQKIKQRIRIELEDFLIPTRNYQSFKSKFEGTYHLIFQKPEGELTKNLPSVRYIGVGYKDKGSASKPEKDGSPNWKDIASSAENILREISEKLDQLIEGTNNGKLTFAEKLRYQRYIISKKKEYHRLRRDPLKSQGITKENKGKT